MNYFFSPLNSPIDNAEDDWTMTNQFLQGILPDYNSQKSDDRWDMMSLQNSAHIENSGFCNSAHSSNTSADLESSSCSPSSSILYPPKL